MTNAEKRALEIYTSLLLQQIRKNNSNALNDIKAFFYGPSFRKTYNPELLYQICIENLEILEKIPSHTEILLCFNLNSNQIEFTKNKIKKLYPKSLSTMSQRRAIFSGLNIQLYPKIKDNELFHQNLLTFYKELCIIGKDIPIKLRKCKLWK